MEKQGKVYNSGRMRPVEKCSQCESVFLAAVFSCDPCHDMGVVDQTGIAETVDLSEGFIKAVVFLHKQQDVIQAAFNTEIKMTNSGNAEIAEF